MRFLGKNQIKNSCIHCDFFFNKKLRGGGGGKPAPSPALLHFAYNSSDVLIVFSSSAGKPRRVTIERQEGALHHSHDMRKKLSQINLLVNELMFLILRENKRVDGIAILQ